MEQYSIESFGLSDLGLVRESNEDVFHELPMHRFFVLADGMGGHNAGEIAARELVHHLSTSIRQIFSDEKTSPQTALLAELLDKAIASANQWVHELSEQKKELNGMGTTLCCLLLHQNSLVYANVGDSRIYRFRKELFQISEDHSLVPSSLTGTHSGKNIITRAIGTGPQVKPYINIDNLAPGDVYLLCSDGLTNHVSDRELAAILEKNTCIKQASQEMIHTAKTKGGNDNITVLLVRVHKDA